MTDRGAATVKRHVSSRVAATLAFVLAGPSMAAAQDADGGQDLAQAASDPTASLMSFQVQDLWSFDLHGVPDDRNIVQFRSALPYEAFGVKNIARLTVPVVTHGPGVDAGLADATLFNLAAFDRSWGRFGVGAVALLPTGGASRGLEQYAIGPAGGFVARSSGRLVGVFNQNLFRVAGGAGRDDVAVSTIQPILNQSLGDGWAVGTSDMTVVYDWNEGEFTSLPIGVKVSKLTRAFGIPLQLQLSYERNFYDARWAARDTIGLTAKMLLPR